MKRIKSFCALYFSLFDKYIQCLQFFCQDDYKEYINRLLIAKSLLKYLMQNPITLEQQRKVWIVHQSLNGSTYYFNRASKKSQYQMPECFKTTQQQLDHPDWRQYRTAEGKKFYYNAINKKTSLIMPHQVKQFKLRKDQQRKRLKEQNGGILPQQQKLSQTEQNKKQFMIMLKQKGIQINTKWDSCAKICEDDERWNLLKISDKKRYFNQYLGDIKKQMDKAKKEKTEQNKVLFLKMLRENKTLTSDCKMHRMAPQFTTDPRWRLLQGSQRQNAFQQFVDDLVIKQREQAKQNKRLNGENLRKCIEDDQIKYNMKWDDFCDLYKNNPYYLALHPYDRMSIFVDYILQVEKKHEEQAIRQKKLKERINRVNFRKMLRDKLSSGQLSYKIKWRNFVKQHKDDPNFQAMMDPQQPGTSGHQIFEHVLDQVRDNHKNIKGQIKHHFKKKGFKMNEETSNQQFMEKLNDLEPFTVLPPLLRQYFYSYFQHKIKSKNSGKVIPNTIPKDSQAKQTKQSKQVKQKQPNKKSKKQKKVMFKIFKQLNINPDNKYSIDQYMDKIERDMKQSSIQMTRQNILKSYLQFLSEKDDDKKTKKQNSSNSDSETQNKKRKKRKQIDEEKQHKQAGKSLKYSENQQQGQIKDQQIQERQKKKVKGKKNKRKRSKSRNSSSESDSKSR